MKIPTYAIMLALFAGVTIGGVSAIHITNHFTEDVVISPGELGVGVSDPKASLHVKAGSQASGTNAIFIDKTRDAVNSVRFSFNDVGGLTTDGGGGAYWRGVHLTGPKITEGGQNVFPVLSTFAEYEKLTDPTQKLWIISANKNFDVVYRAEKPTGDVDLMYLKQDGKVGFGTSAPSEKVEIVGNVKINGNILSDGDICIGNCP